MIERDKTEEPTGPEGQSEAPLRDASTYDPPGNVGCMLVLGGILLSVPFIFLLSYAVVGVLVAGFAAWMCQLTFFRKLSPKIAPWKILTTLWILFALLFLGLMMSGLLGSTSTHGDRY